MSTKNRASQFASLLRQFFQQVITSKFFEHGRTCRGAQVKTLKRGDSLARTYGHLVGGL
jgi:hypothetical protein